MSETDFECLLVEENSILLVCTAKVHLLKLQDADHEQDVDQPNPICAQQAIYEANKEEKEVAYVWLNISIKQSLRPVDVHYSTNRQLQGCLEGKE